MKRLTLFRRGDERGLTIVELMASVLIFGLITVGLTPLLTTSVRSAGMSRSYTVGKNIAVQAMERVRGLPYFISYATQNSKVDVLDLYFPSISEAGYNPADGTFTTVCTAATAANPSCPGGLQEGYTITYVAQFVRGQDGAVPTDPETYVNMPPPAAYAWNGQDTPPSRLLRMSIRTSWTWGGVARNHGLTSLVSDRRLSDNKISGNARLDYIVQVLASYVHFGQVSDLKFRAGISESRIESRLLSEAYQNTTAGDARLTQPSQVSGGDAVELGRALGAQSIYKAPPNTADPAPAAAVDIVRLSHPNLGRVAMFNNSFTGSLKARVLDENPESSGSLGMNTSGTNDWWVNNQATFGTETSLQLNNSALSHTSDANPAIINMTKRDGQSIAGSSSAYTGALGSSDRRVRTSASGSFKQLNIFPVSFIGSGAAQDRAVIQIRDFTSNVTCDSTANASAQASATYSASLRYWSVDSWSPSNQLGSLSNTSGSYKPVSLSGTNTSDPLADIGPEPEKNPLVWKSPSGTSGAGSAFDIYLFPIRHEHTVLGLPVIHDHPGYLDPDAPWESAFNLASATEKSGNGRNTSARLGGAIRLTSVRLNPSIPQSGLNVSVGNMACSASDLR